MDNTVKKFFALIRYAVGVEEPVPQVEPDEWQEMFILAQEQAIAGVVFGGIENLKHEEIGIPRDVMLQWFAVTERIKQRNRLMNQRCVELSEMLQKDGFTCCILKGQGNAIMYPNPLLRISGDIDILVFGGRETVTEYVKKKFPHTKTAYQHIDYPVFKDVAVEVHYLPIYVNNPIFNRKIQNWFKNQGNSFVEYKTLQDGEGRIPVPSIEFNIFYQLMHIMHHYFDEGIGLRQFADYYYLLRSSAKLEMRNEELEMTQKYLGLWKFAGAVMYVMREVFHLEELYMIAPVDERRGKTLLNEILRGGNFGKHSGLTDHSIGVKYFLKIIRNLHFVWEYPAEALCEPVFRTWHFFWRMAHR